MSTEITTALFNESHNGSSRIPWNFNEKIMIAISYSTSIALSSIGNTLVLVVFWVGSLRPNRNNDVRQFLTNLAVSDLLISLFCLPFTFTYILLWDWPFPHVFCPTVLFIQLLAVTASSVTNMVIGLDRFWVVIYPLKSRITRRKSGWVIGCIWVSSILYSSVQCFVSRAEVTKEGYTDCTENWNNNFLQVTYTISIMLVTYILPLCVLTVTYSIVGLKLWKRALPGEADQTRDAKHLKSKIKVIKMLSIIVICFGLCWLPLQLFFVQAHISQDIRYTKSRNIVYVVCHWIAMSNSFVNPVVYSFMNDSFKSDFRWLIYQKCCAICHRHFWSNTFSYKTASTRNSVSNNVSANLTIHNRKYHPKFQLSNHSPEKTKEEEFSFQKNSDKKPNTITKQVTCNPDWGDLSSVEPNRLHVRPDDRGPKLDYVRSNQYYQIITQL